MSNIFKKRGQKIAKKSRRHIEKNLVNRISHVKDIRLMIVEWGLLVVSIIAVSIIQVFWYKGSYAVNSYNEGGAYIEGTLGKINSINPLLSSTNSEKTLSKLLYLGLTSSDYSGHTGNVLAKSVFSTNGKQWSVKLKDNLKWSDGEPITNEDVLFTVNLIKKSSTKTPYSTNLSGVSVSEDKDSKNLIFTLASSYADFDSALDFPILPKHIFSESKTIADLDFSSNSAFSGPFTLKTVQQIGNTGDSVIYLSSNETYYKESPFLSNFSVRTFSDTKDIISALNSGSITGTPELKSTDADLITSKNIYEKASPINSGVYAFINTKSELLSSKTLRKAIQKGLNVEELRSIANEEKALSYPILSSQVSLDKWPELPAFDLESAKSVVSGIESIKETPLEIATITTGYFPTLAEDLAEQLEALGFSTHVSTYEPTQDFIANVIGNRAYDILLYEISLGADPDLFAYYHSSQASETGLNLSNYSNPLADDAILTARESLNQDVRSAKYAAFLEYWIDDVPGIGIYQPSMSYYFNRNTRIFSEDNSFVTQFDRFNDIEYWASEKTTKNRTP